MDRLPSNHSSPTSWWEIDRDLNFHGISQYSIDFQYGRTLAEMSGIENDLFQSALVNIKKKEGDEAEEKDAANESMDGWSTDWSIQTNLVM